MQKQKILPLKLISKLLNLDKPMVLVILIYGLGFSTMSLVVPIGIQTIINNVSFGVLNLSLFFLVFALFFGLGTASTLRILQTVLVENFQRKFFTKTAIDLAVRLPKITSRVDVNRFFDVLTIQKSCSILLIEGFSLILQILFGLTLLAFYHPTLLVFDIFILAAICTILFAFGRGAIKKASIESIHKFEIASFLEDLANQKILFLSKSAREYALKKVDEKLVQYLKSRDSQFKIVLRQLIAANGLQVIAGSSLLGIGSYLVTKNQLSLGQLVASEIIVTTALASFSKFHKHLEAFYDLVAALDKVDSLLQSPIEKNESLDLLNSKNPMPVEVKDLCVRFPDGNEIFNNLSFKVEAGKSIAIEGMASSGKSTLVDILYGIKSFSSGIIYFDGIDSKTLLPEQLRESIFFLRGLNLLPSTILENLTLGDKSISMNQINEALEKVELLTEIQKLKDGLLTQIDNQGSPLSLVQGLRLNIARAFLKPYRLILIDEALGSLDDISSQKISKQIFSETKWTTIISTHDNRIKQQCNKIITLDKRYRGAA